MDLPEDIVGLTDAQLSNRINLIRQEITAINSQISQYLLDTDFLKQQTDDLKKKLKLYQTLPYQVAVVSECIAPVADAEQTSYISLEKQDNPIILKTTSKQMIYLPTVSMKLEPGALVAVSRDTFNVFYKLPMDYDSKVKTMEIIDKPTDRFCDIGGLDRVIQMIKESVVLAMNHEEKFREMGIEVTKGILMYGAPGVGKTMMARAVANEVGCAFFRLSGTDLVQTYIGEGARMVREIFALARQRKRAIIFIDEIDAVAAKRSSNHESGSRDVNRTMLELLNQLDGFDTLPEGCNIKVIAATNRVDVLDPALIRAGRIDRKIEFPMPDERGREAILRIHSRKLRVSGLVDFRELAQATEDFNGAQLKAVCVEAGMHAIKRRARELVHEDYVEGIAQVKAKRTEKISFYV